MLCLFWGVGMGLSFVCVCVCVVECITRSATIFSDNEESL